MAQSLIQTSFFGGELSPNLYGTVDLAQYKKSVAKMRNFFPDYRGGASTRFGTKYVLQALNSNFPVRLIRFTASFNVEYVLELGQNYIRFHTNGGPVIETAQAVSAASGNTITSAGTYNVGDWILYNNNYYIVVGVAGSVYTVTDLYGHTPSLSFVAGSTTARIYTIQSPWAGADLALVKYAQNVQYMILCHPNYPAQLLTYNGPTNWVLTTITYGATIGAPTGVSVAQTGTAVGYNTEYVVTAVDNNGQESVASNIATLVNGIAPFISAPSNPVSITVTWSAVPGALYYNVYRTQSVPTAIGVPPGSLFGLIASTQATSYTETYSDSTKASNFVPPNFSITPPQAQNPFLGGPVSSATITAPGVYTTIPTVSFTSPAVGTTAAGTVTLGLVSETINNGGSGYAVGNSVVFPHGVVLIVATVGTAGQVLSFQPLTYPGSSVGAITSGTIPANMASISSGGIGSNVVIACSWGVTSILILTPGSGYTTPPTITFSSGVAAATAVLGPLGGNPSVPCYFQQRLVLAAPLVAPQTEYFSVPGAPYNFNTHLVTEADDAITAILVSKELNSIKSLVPMPAGLVTLTSTSAWLINGGSGAGSPVTPINISAQSQAYNGANDVPPLVANDDILYVQAKGAIVRDLRFNFYTAVYTGIDISVLAEHLFFGYQIKEWTWAEEPFKIVYAVRSDGILLSLTFSKEQEIYGWAHHDTQGLFQSVTDITEVTPNGAVSATYVVVQRTINGQTLKYIERMADRFIPNGLVDAWCLDCALQSTGTAPFTTFSGLAQLEGQTVTALADGVVVTGLTVSNGTVTLPNPASKVLVGLPYLPQLQTLPLDAGQPTIQGKRKRPGPMAFKVTDTRGLSVGRTFSTMVNVKDAGPPMLSTFPGLIFGDEWVVLDALYDPYGQICFQQNNPWPATVMAVIPDISVGDTVK